MIELSVSIASVPLEAIMSQASILGNFKVKFFFTQISLSYLSVALTSGRGSDFVACSKASQKLFFFKSYFYDYQYKNDSSFGIKS